VAFVQALIPHHRQGITLATAVARVPAARTLAEAIIVTQQDEVVRMSGWLREWSAAVPSASAAVPSASAAVPSAPAAAPSASAAVPTASAASSAAAGLSSTASRDPIRALIAHQEEAIRLAQQEQANGTNPAALAFARQIVESRTEEIAQLRTYLG
jgi:uncharacterized protein (DUF305 family)